MGTLHSVILVSGKTIGLVLVAPLVSGVIRKIKNILRMRQGPGIFQLYHNLRKLFGKSEVISRHTSWIFGAAPAVAFAASSCALVLILLAQSDPSVKSGVVIVLAAFFVLGLGRFFLALAGLDVASSFGGMGSSREMFISCFAEPAAFVAVFAIGMGSGPFRVSGCLAGTALLLVVLAETSRIPVDNQETHLELTMVHEAMVLEYSGPSLALIELAGHVKQMIFFILLAWFFFPVLADARWEQALFPVKIAAIGLVVAVVEISVAKMRLFRVVDFLSFSFFMALLGAVAAGLGF